MTHHGHQSPDNKAQQCTCEPISKSQAEITDMFIITDKLNANQNMTDNALLH